MLSGKGLTQPQRAGAGDFDFHQDLILRQQELAVIAGRQRQAISAPADVAVEGDAQFRLFQTGPGGAVISNIHPGHGIVEALEPLQFLPNLSPFGRGGFGMQKALGLGQGRGNAALIHHAATLLFQLHKDLIFCGGNPVAAQPQFFFIGGFFQRSADELKIFGITVDVADGVCSYCSGI